MVGGSAGAAGAAPAPTPRDRRLVWVGVALGAVAVAALLVGRALRSDSVAAPRKTVAARADAPAKPARPEGPGKSAAPSAPAPADLAERLADARRTLARGDWEQARAALEGMRAEAPDNADVAYLLATIDLEHHRYAEGMAAAQVAAHRDPALKSDPDLIKDVIAALASDPASERAETFLRGAGPQATPFLKDAARKDPNPRVRDRASALLAERGGRSSVWPSHSSSSGSMFRR
jgi:hypothetical protein